MFVMWFFFTKAVKFRPSVGYPYVVWLMTSMILWMFLEFRFCNVGLYIQELLLPFAQTKFQYVDHACCQHICRH